MRNRLCISLLCSLVNIAWTTSAYAVSSTIVISQVYPGAGEGGSKLHNKYIELFNRGTASVSIQGWSVQYAEGSGITWTAIALTGTIAAGQYYLIADGASSEDVTGVPRPDVAAFPTLDDTSGRL